MKPLIVLWCILIPWHWATAQTDLQHRTYNTEFGRFDVWIQGSQVTGSYQIVPKRVIGSVWAKLDGMKATGRWKDPDGEGDIILLFEAGFQKFTADYNNDKNPNKWFRDQWHATQLKDHEDKPPCTSASHDLIKPFIGTWEEYELDASNQETFIGVLQVQLTAGGCALAQRFMSPDSSFSYATQGHVNPGSGFWEEKYVFSTGGTADYQWVIDKGDIVQRRVGGTRRIDYLHQLRFTELSSTGYLVLVEQSTDGGKTWTVKERTRVKRRK